MAVDQAAPKSAPFAQGSIIWQRKGPLPVWAWALIVLGLVLAVTMWRRNKAAGEADEARTGHLDELPGDQTSGPIFIVPQAPTPPVTVNTPVTVTVPPAPPGGGAPPPTVPPKVPTPTPVPKPPAGTWVKVAKFTSTNPPWNSTLSGIWSASKQHGAKLANWQAIWTDPLNADLRTKRGAADRIQPNDMIFVRGWTK